MNREALAALMAGVDLLGLADLIDRPAWMTDALCREHPEVEFHPGRGEPTAPAKAVCARCAVRPECLDYAVSRPADHCYGVWGGTSERERRALRRMSRHSA